MTVPLAVAENSQPLPMALSSAPPVASSDPPWPPDVCFVDIVSDLQSGRASFDVALHPEVPPSSSPVPSIPVAVSSSLGVVGCFLSDPTISPPPALWVFKLTSTSHNLKKMDSPTFASDGTPIVKAPESVILRSSALWKGWLVAQFHGTAPSPTKIFSDLNPIWRKQGRIRVRHHSKNVCLIFIPCEVVRKWVFDVAFWHSGKCAFTVSEWSPNMNLAPMKLEYAPGWVLFRNVPVELWSFEGFSSFATGVGFPVQSEFPTLKPYSNGVVKLRVIVKLEGNKASSVKVVDKLQNSVTISAEYLNLPHKCHICFDFGHSEQRCPKQNILLTLNAPLPGIVHSSPTPRKESSAQKEKTPTVSAARSDLPNHKTNSGSEAESSSKGGSVAPQGQTSLRKSRSLPSIRTSTSKANGPLEWVVVGSKSPSRRSSPKPISFESVKNLSSSHFDSEDELISADQLIIRKRLEEAEADFPPFSTVKEKKKIRKYQRQAMVQLCEGAQDDPLLKANSSIPKVNKVESSEKGLAPIIPEA